VAISARFCRNRLFSLAVDKFHSSRSFRHAPAIARHTENGSVKPLPLRGRRRRPSPFGRGDEHVLACHRRRALTIRTFCTLAAAIFALIALLQLIRIVMGWSVTLNGVDVPFWASWIAVTVAGALSFVGFRAAMRS
jgi:hypothetical protein